MSAIDKIGASIANTGVYKAASKKVDQACTALGTAASKSLDKTESKLGNFIKAVEPTGANNSFITMTALMIGMVITPRVLTAAKRNPDNKEATKDEITEILFRDVQTVAIILFLLKMMNSVIAGKVSKLSGLPMTNKPYESVFQTSRKGLEGLGDKAREFLDSPGKKLKTIGKNILDTIHPTGGVRALTNDEFVSRYSLPPIKDDLNGSVKNIQKLFTEIGDKKGSPEKTFSKVVDTLISEQEKTVAQFEGSGLDTELDKVKDVLEKLKELKSKGISAISDENISKLDDNVKTKLVNFFKDTDNKLVRDAKKLNAGLRTGALAIESLYLGFGLPALNQKRLEKKYLENQHVIETDELIVRGSFNPLIDKTIKPQEITVFKNFIH